MERIVLLLVLLSGLAAFPAAVFAEGFLGGHVADAAIGEFDGEGDREAAPRLDLQPILAEILRGT